MINNDSIIPLYEQISNKIQERIRHGELKPGERIGSINELLKEYDISRVTAVNAIEDLVKKGFAVKRQGKGTFVKNDYIGEELMSLRSFKEISIEGSSRILDYGKTDFSDEVSDIFGGAKSGVMIRRLQLFKDKPIGLIVMLLPDYVMKDIDFDVKLLERISMFEHLESSGVRIVTAKQAISAAAADAPVAKLLGLTAGKPILFVTRTSYDDNMRAVMFSTFYYRSDSYSYKVTLNRNMSSSRR